MEVSRQGVKFELQLPAYTTVTAMPDASHICVLYHSSWQRWILKPVSEARDRTCNLMVSSQIRFCCATVGTPLTCNFFMTKYVVHLFMCYFLSSANFFWVIYQLKSFLFLKMDCLSHPQVKEFCTYFR